MCGLRRLLRVRNPSVHNPRPQLNYCGDPHSTAHTKPRAPDANGAWSSRRQLHADSEHRVHHQQHVAEI